MTGEPDPALRLALVGDAEALALVHIKSWCEIYRGVFPERVLEALDATRHAQFWRASVVAAPGCTVVCERDRAKV